MSDYTPFLSGKDDDYIDLLTKLYDLYAKLHEIHVLLLKLSTETVELSQVIEWRDKWKPKLKAIHSLWERSMGDDPQGCDIKTLGCLLTAGYIVFELPRRGQPEALGTVAQEVIDTVDDLWPVTPEDHVDSFVLERIVLDKDRIDVKVKHARQSWKGIAEDLQPEIPTKDNEVFGLENSFARSLPVGSKQYATDDSFTFTAAPDLPDLSTFISRPQIWQTCTERFTPTAGSDYTIHHRRECSTESDGKAYAEFFEKFCMPSTTFC
jgi:hypothetical protein